MLNRQMWIGSANLIAGTWCGYAALRIAALEHHPGIMPLVFTLLFAVLVTAAIFYYVKGWSTSERS